MFVLLQELHVESRWNTCGCQELQIFGGKYTRAESVHQKKTLAICSQVNKGTEDKYGFVSPSLLFFFCFLGARWLLSKIEGATHLAGVLKETLLLSFILSPLGKK